MRCVSHQLYIAIHKINCRISAAELVDDFSFPAVTDGLERLLFLLVAYWLISACQCNSVYVEWHAGVYLRIIRNIST